MVLSYTQPRDDAPSLALRTARFWRLTKGAPVAGVLLGHG
jgi:hypothetical protein